MTPIEAARMFLDALEDYLELRPDDLSPRLEGWQKRRHGAIEDMAKVLEWLRSGG